MKRLLFFLLCVTCMLFSPEGMNMAKAKDFVVVIDAGHGGHDSGARGKFSDEKNINLTVALKVGELIRKNCRDVRLIYTRNTDVFIPLQRRAEIANNAKADLFISIHTNALANNTTYMGASTYTLGLAKAAANLAVAKRENSVILYESDYKKRYAGFDPNSAESYIIFEFMQDKYMKQSVHLASLVQKQFKGTCRRIDRGVHQAGFLVLKASAMPSVLIELGFISTPEEEQYLNSSEGTDNLANGIYRAFLTYKREHELRTEGKSDTVVPPVPEKVEDEEPENSYAGTDPFVQKNEPADASAGQLKEADKSLPEAATASSDNADSEPIVFKVQFLSSSVKLRDSDRRLEELEGVTCYSENGVYKYVCGDTTDYDAVLRTRRLLSERFKDAFVVAFRGDAKMDVHEAISIYKKNRR